MKNYNDEEQISDARGCGGQTCAYIGASWRHSGVVEPFWLLTVVEMAKYRA